MKEPSGNRKHVVFDCVENANRSQMAEAFVRMADVEGVIPFSAGSRPSGKVNPRAVEAMREKGYDLGTHGSKSLDDLPVVEWDAVVTMGCGDECPYLPAKRRVDWQIPDPKSMPAEEFRKVRDLIETRVNELLETL